MSNSTTQKPARKYLTDIPLPKDFHDPIVIPEEEAQIIDNYNPECDSLKLKKQLYNLHLQRLTMKAAPMAIAKITDLLDSKKPEVARRAAMTILQMSHLNSAPDLLPLGDDLFDDPSPPLPRGGQASRSRASAPPDPPATPSPLITPSTFTLTTPPPKTSFNPTHLIQSLTPLLLLAILFLHPTSSPESPITNYHLPITASSTAAPSEPNQPLRAFASSRLIPPVPQKNIDKPSKTHISLDAHPLTDSMQFTKIFPPQPHGEIPMHILPRKILPTILLAACALTSSALAADPKILTNQLGYETIGPKHAVILGHAGDQITAYKILNADTNEQVASGIPTKTGPVDQWKDWIFWSIDFSDVKADGSYLIEATTSKGEIHSFPFLIEKNLLERHTISDLVYYFKDQRTIGQTNKADAHLQFEDSADKSKTLDLHGGWADATGDSGKHMSHLNFATYFNPQQIPMTTWVLFKSYEELRARKEKNFGPIERRMLDEALYGADYLCRSKNPDGSFYRSVDDNGPNPEKRFVAKDGSGGLIKKTKNPNPLQDGDMSKISNNFLYEISGRCGGAMCCASLALASTYKVSGDYTQAEYLKAAEDGFAFLSKYNNYYTNDGKDNIIDDYCFLMAATELYKATKKEDYKTAADARAKSLLARLTTSGKYANYFRADDGDRPFFHAADAGFPVVALLNYNTIADDTTKATVLDTVKKELQFELTTTAEVPNPFGYARQLVQSKNGFRRTTFFFPHDADVAPWWQGENARLGSLASAARMAAKSFEDDKPFHDQLEAYAANQLNWILGENPYDVCMLHGNGRNSSEFTPGSYDYIGAPGGICNGITSGVKNPNDIDFNINTHSEDDESWRWNEQWLPHSTWFLFAVAQGIQ